MSRDATSEVDGLDHIALTVRDMDRALGFYRDLLGCEALGQLLLEGGRRKLVYLRSGRAYLELFADRPAEDAPQRAASAAGGTAAVGTAAAPRPLGFQHVAFHAGDVDAVAARLAAAGVPITLGPLDAAGNVRLAFCTDPDGNSVEIVARLPDMEPYRPGWA